MSKKSLGDLGEKLACKFLWKKKYKLVSKNFRSKFGEIDFIFINKSKTIFVEVKTRTSLKYGLPQEAINQAKIRKIKKTAQYFLLRNPSLPNSYRIDLVAINLEPKTNFIKNIKHYKNISQ